MLQAVAFKALDEIAEFLAAAPEAVASQGGAAVGAARRSSGLQAEAALVP